MCSNLTNQVRSITSVTNAVAKGDLTQRVEVEAEGEMATLKVSSQVLFEMNEILTRLNSGHYQLHGRAVANFYIRGNSSRT